MRVWRKDLVRLIGHRWLGLRHKLGRLLSAGSLEICRPSVTKSVVKEYCDRRKKQPVKYDRRKSVKVYVV